MIPDSLGLIECKWKKWFGFFSDTYYYRVKSGNVNGAVCDKTRYSDCGNDTILAN